MFCSAVVVPVFRSEWADTVDGRFGGLHGGEISPPKWPKNCVGRAVKLYVRLNVPLPSTKSQYWSGSGGTFPAERWFSAPKMGWLLPSPSRTNWKPSILGAERRRRMWCRRWRWPFDLDAGRRPGRIASHVAIVTFFLLFGGWQSQRKVRTWVGRMELTSPKTRWPQYGSNAQPFWWSPFLFLGVDIVDLRKPHFWPNAQSQTTRYDDEVFKSIVKSCLRAEAAVWVQLAHVAMVIMLWRRNNTMAADCRRCSILFQCLSAAASDAEYRKSHLKTPSFYNVIVTVRSACLWVFFQSTTSRSSLVNPLLE